MTTLLAVFINRSVDIQDVRRLSKMALKEAFMLFDKDDDGVITEKELHEIMQSLGLNASALEIEDIINEVDLEQTGSINLDDFIKMMAVEAIPAQFEEEMHSAFKVFDKDNSGTISANEIAQVMLSFGEKLSDEELILMIKEVDKNGDGTIGYDEFVSFISES